MPTPGKNTDLLAALVERLADAVAAHLEGIGGAARTKRKPTISRAGIERIRAAQKKRAALDAFGYCSGCWVHVHRKCTAAGTCRLVEEESKKRGSDA